MLLVGDSAGGVYGFDGESGAALWSHQMAHEGGLLALAINPEGTAFATAGQDERLLIWDAAEGQTTKAIDIDNGWVENVAWSPNGKWLAASCSRQVRVFDLGGDELWRSDDHPSTISTIAWSKSSELATACYGQATFMEGPTGTIRQRLKWKGSLISMALSPDGKVVACGSQDNSVHFWRRSTGHDSMMPGYPGKPTALAFDTKSTLLATGGDATVTVWSFQGRGPEGTHPGRLQLHVKTVSTLSFAPRGRRLASGGRDGAVVVWSLQKDGEGEPVGAALVPDVVAEVYWRPDGRALAALDAQGGVTVWRVGE